MQSHRMEVDLGTPDLERGRQLDFTFACRTLDQLTEQILRSFERLLAVRAVQLEIGHSSLKCRD
jgi:hypothetical protein